MLYQAMRRRGRGYRRDDGGYYQEGAIIPVRIRETIDGVELLPSHHLLRDVAADASLGLDIFGSSPNQMTEHLKAVRRRYQTRREDVAAVLRRSHARLGASAATLANLDRLTQPTTFVVIGGQTLVLALTPRPAEVVLAEG